MESAERVEHPPAFRLLGIQKHFGGTQALRDVSLGARSGEVHAIVGENGAGKSTLVKILAGVYPNGAYEGDLVVRGVHRQFSGVRDAERAGIFLVPQELNVVPTLNVAENLFLNREPSRFGRLDYRSLWSDTGRWLRLFQLDVLPTTPMQRLSTGQQQLVKIAHAMSEGVEVLILDEPTASLTERETELLFERIREFDRHGVTTVYISHRLDEIAKVASRVTIMRDGRIVETLDLKDPATTPRRIVHGMVGREIEDMYPKLTTTPGDVAFEISGLAIENRVPGRPRLVDDVSLDVRRGEIVGLFGAVGSGTSQLVAAAFGAWPGPVTGTVTVRGKVVSGGPRAAINAGLGLISADRKHTGLVLSMSVGANMTLASIGRYASRGRIDRRRELTTIRTYMDRLRVKASGVDQSVAELSGGNQQKVVAGKWLVADPEVLILEEPTHGIDVGAKVEMYALMGELAKEGRALLLVSSDIQEIIAMSDRIVVLYKGRVAGRWNRAEAVEHDVSAAASGGDAASRGDVDD
jgi:D-xylose transport system ATP-binding protein